MAHKSEFRVDGEYIFNQASPIRWILSHMWRHKKFFITGLFGFLIAYVSFSYARILIGEAAEEIFNPSGPDAVTRILKFKEEDRFKDYLWEPDQQTVLDEIVPRHFKTQLFRSVLESVASEHGARMSAMESATNNAEDMISRLTLQYNKARQAAITTELMEIIGGVEAMK